MWLANPQPTFWQGVPVGSTLCQKCYGVGHRARARGKVPARPRQITTSSSASAETFECPEPAQRACKERKIHAEVASCAADDLHNSQNGLRQHAPRENDDAAACPRPHSGIDSLQEDEQLSNDIASSSNHQPDTNHQPEPPQSHKRRRTLAEIEDAEERRLMKSLPLYDVPLYEHNHRPVQSASKSRKLNLQPMTESAHRGGQQTPTRGEQLFDAPNANGAPGSSVACSPNVAPNAVLSVSQSCVLSPAPFADLSSASLDVVSVGPFCSFVNGNSPGFEPLYYQLPIKIRPVVATRGAEAPFPAVAFEPQVQEDPPSYAQRPPI